MCLSNLYWFNYSSSINFNYVSKSDFNKSYNSTGNANRICSYRYYYAFSWVGLYFNSHQSLILGHRGASFLDTGFIVLLEDL